MTAYFLTHPDVNAFFSSVQGLSKEEARTQTKSYLAANPQVQNDINFIRGPVFDCETGGHPDQQRHPRGALSPPGCPIVGPDCRAGLVSALMRLVVDLNKCQGYAQCVPLAPEVLNSSVKRHLPTTRTPTTPSANRCCARWRRAPVQAIILELDRPLTGTRCDRDVLVRRDRHDVPGRRPDRHRGRFAGRTARSGGVAGEGFQRIAHHHR